MGLDRQHAPARPLRGVHGEGAHVRPDVHDIVFRAQLEAARGVHVAVEHRGHHAQYVHSLRRLEHGAVAQQRTPWLLAGGARMRQLAPVAVAARVAERTQRIHAEALRSAGPAVKRRIGCFA